MPQAPDATWRFKRFVGRVTSRLVPLRVPEVVSGEGCIAEIAHVLLGLGVRRPLVVTDKDLVAAGVAGQCTAALSAADLDFDLFDDVEPNPTSASVEAGFALYCRGGCDSIIAVGGGSPMDCAKVIGAKVANPKDVEEYGGLFAVSMATMFGLTGKLPPLVAVPTTAGSGSEATVGAVITLKAKKTKITIADPGLIPNAAVLDPQLHRGCPKGVTAASGMDALTHAIESFLSGWAHADTRRRCLRAAAEIFKYLPTAYRNGENMEARRAMLHASFEAGLCFTRTHCGYVHTIAHQFGGLFHTPHGIANSMLLPHVLRYYISDETDGGLCSELLYQLAEAAGLTALCKDEGPARKRVVLARRLIERVGEMNEELNIPQVVPEMRASDVREVAVRALREAHGEQFGPGPFAGISRLSSTRPRSRAPSQPTSRLQYVLDLGYPVPKYMTLAECEAIVAQCLPAEERLAWESALAAPVGAPALRARL